MTRDSLTKQLKVQTCVQKSSTLLKFLHCPSLQLDEGSYR